VGVLSGVYGHQCEFAFGTGVENLCHMPSLVYIQYMCDSLAKVQECLCLACPWSKLPIIPSCLVTILWP
jgi:hypothetical protein